MTLLDTITEEIKKAMLSKDKVRLEALRGIKKELLEAKTAKGAAGDLSDEAATAILQKMVKQRKDSAAIFTEQGRKDLAEPELAQVAVIEKFLPAQMSEAEVETEVAKIIAEGGFSGMAAMGQVMGIASKNLAGKTDGKTISTIVKKLLN